MQLSEVYLALGEDALGQLLRNVSLGKLKTYQLYERVKTRFRLAKLNSETLRKASPRLWVRLNEHDEELASDLAQAILVSHLEMIKQVLDLLGVPHEEGFFAKDADVSSYLTDGWQQRVFDKLKDAWPRPVLLFYLNHLSWELGKAGDLFAPAA